ncbi:MAG: glycoside hydrolase family 5 protein [Ruminococcaceae bacterium]|nr:glycoside hydrolase family 5 protein [Oscillospiraceae bacterium]
MDLRWSIDKAWNWYNARPWIRGCNYMSRDCANRIDQWQELGFEERLKTTDEELSLAASIGFNSIRIIPEFIVWLKEHDGFMERFERYLEVAHKHKISCMIVFGNDCMPPKDEALKRLTLGEQKVEWGYHGGRKVSQHGTFCEHGYHLLDEPEMAQKHYEWVKEIVTKYKDDDRIIMWDVFNEPGNSNRKSMSLPHLKKFVEIIREINPVQPITVGVWGADIDNLSEIERFGLDNSDIISYHSYGELKIGVEVLKKLKKFKRPVVNTEWLARCMNNNVQEMFPIFYLENVGCYNWGFVAGKYQTYEPWNSIWDKYEKDKNINWDFTKWFHDLYRPSLHPYDPKEIEIVKHFCKLADEEFEKERNNQ